jgi:hypothetical protein
MIRRDAGNSGAMLGVERMEAAADARLRATFRT